MFSSTSDSPCGAAALAPGHDLHRRPTHRLPEPHNLCLRSTTGTGEQSRSGKEGKDSHRRFWQQHWSAMELRPGEEPTTTVLRVYGTPVWLAMVNPSRGCMSSTSQQLSRTASSIQAHRAIAPRWLAREVTAAALLGATAGRGIQAAQFYSPKGTAADPEIGQDLNNPRAPCMAASESDFGWRGRRRRRTGESDEWARRSAQSGGLASGPQVSAPRLGDGLRASTP
jgi:hypothetical protein